MYATGGRSRTAAKIVAVVLFIGGVLLFSGVASAGVGTETLAIVAGRSLWSYLLDLILIILLLGVPLS